MSSDPIKAKILYVDDDPIMQKLVPFFLAQHFQVRTAGNGHEGVEIALKWLPDLILTELRMPIIDGFQATQVLHADPRTRQIPIVAFMAPSEASLRAKAQEAGLNGFIPKSSLLVDLVRTLHNGPFNRKMN
jgi:CheY-like chemotaxis protein